MYEITPYVPPSASPIASSANATTIESDSVKADSESATICSIVLMPNTARSGAPSRMVDRIASTSGSGRSFVRTTSVMPSSEEWK